MPFWSFSSTSRGKASSKWIDEVAMPSMQNDGELHLHISSSKRTNSSTLGNVRDSLETRRVDDMTRTSRCGRKHDDRDGDGPILPPPNGNTSFPNRHKRSALHAFSVHWARFKRHIGTGTAPSSDSNLGDPSVDDDGPREQEGNNGADEATEVDEIVVDRTWDDDVKGSDSEGGPSAEKSVSTPHHTATAGVSEHESPTAIHDHDGNWAWTILRWRIIPAIFVFFSCSFLDDKTEHHYRQEYWFVKKTLGLWSALWLIINWLLGIAFVPGSFTLMDKIFYFGFAPIASLPVVFMVMYDWPRDRPKLYQCFLCVSIWSWSFYQVLFMILCGFYSHDGFGCGTKDFLGLFYYTSALQTIALFGLKLNRFPAAVGATAFLIFCCATVVPDRITWTRNIINFAVFHAFLIYLHFMGEMAERRLYNLREQLKTQFKATQKAQNNERKEAESKRRLASYVFHEVRVPLNTALLAVQNMEASGTVVKDQEIEFDALKKSLTMMSTVLNDVLDFNRMDSGKFEFASKPYAFHQVIRSMFIPLCLATNARGLTFEKNLDPRIDEVARMAMFAAIGKNAHDYDIDEDCEDGLVIGDEARLRQVVNNLASNAVKFTPEGGKLTISTILVRPRETPTPSKSSSSSSSSSHSSHGAESNSSEDDDGVVENHDGPGHHSLSESHLSQHNNVIHEKPLESIVVRIEVTDTGYGIKHEDITKNKLFSAFNQTEQGRQQGGKGTGLGLALVRHIVKLSGGRLGVKSKVGEGSTFWVELPLGVGRKTLESTTPELGSEGSTLTTLDNLSNAVDPKMVPASSIRNPSVRNSWTPSMDLSHRIPATTTGSIRSSSALHNLMEQGGRVELVLSRPEESLTTTPARSTTNTPVNIASSSYSLPARSPSSERLPERPPLNESSSSGTFRPDFVELPIPRPPFAFKGYPSSRTPPPRSPSSELPEMSPLNESSSSGIFRPDLELPIPRPPFAFKGYPFSRTPPPPDTIFSLPTPHTPTDPNTPITRGRKASVSGLPLDFPRGMKVLVVDDDTLTRTLMERLLQRLGCNVTTAENGELALDLILGSNNWTPSSVDSGSGPILERNGNRLSRSELDEPFAIVFLDNQMPVLSGLKAVAKLRAQSRNDFVVGVTGNALLTDQQEYLEAGANHVLTKPVLEKRLKDMLILADQRRKKRPP